MRRTRSTDKIANAKDRPLAVHLQLMTQRRAHAREKLVHAERLGHVVVGAKIERRDLAGLIAAARQHDDRHALVARPDRAQQLDAPACREGRDRE